MKKPPTNNAYFKKILDNLLALDILFSTNPGINFIITKGIPIDNTVSEKELKVCAITYFPQSAKPTISII